MIPKVLEKSKRRIAEICRKYQITELAIFGSQARGDFMANSDFDFLVEFAPDAEIGFIELGFIQEELEKIVEKHVDLVPKKGLKKLIRQKVLEESEIVWVAATKNAPALRDQILVILQNEFPDFELRSEE